MSRIGPLLFAPLLAALLPGCGRTGEPARAPEPGPVRESEGGGEPAFYLGGIQVNEADHQRWLDALEAEGMNTVSVTDYAHQGDWDSDHLWWDEENPGVMSEIRAAEARGVHTVLILRVALDHAFERNRFLWHGMILPKNERLIDSWFEQYTRFAVKWAEVAEREGVDVLMIGSEMNALASTLPVDELPVLEEYFLNPEKQAERRAEVIRHGEMVEERHLELPSQEGFDDVEDYVDARIATERGWAAQVAGGNGEEALEALKLRRRLLQDRWVALIRELRQVYSGRLGYAANFDQYHEVGFWPELDVMGINAYFKLRDHLLENGDSENHDVEALRPLLEAGWEGVLGDVASFRARQGLADQPVIFTEMGYTYRAESTVQPWADTGFALVPVGEPGDGDEPEDGAEREERLVVWRDQPDRLAERALAVRTLHDVHDRLDDPFLEGILYWKLSTDPGHRDIESFVVVLGSDDPILPALRRFLPDR